MIGCTIPSNWHPHTEMPIMVLMVNVMEAIWWCGGTDSAYMAINEHTNKPSFLEGVFDDVIHAHGDHHADARVDEGLKVGIIVPESTVCVCMCV